MTQQFYIYNVDDFFSKWDLLMQDVKNIKTKRGEDFFEDAYNVQKAIAILLFHNLRTEDVIKIRLDDITKEGIKNCDVELSQRELDFLYQYRMQDGFHRIGGKTGDMCYTRYAQNTLVRTFKTQAISVDTITSLFGKRKFEGSEYYSLFNPNTLRTACQYRKLYEYCKEHNLDLTQQGKSGGKVFAPHAETIAKMIELDYNPDNNSNLRRMIQQFYVARFLHLYEEWLTEHPETEPEVVVEQPDVESEPQSEPQPNIDTENRNLLKRKLLDRIAYVEAELDELRKLVELIS